MTQLESANREVIRILEAYICLEAVGYSKPKFQMGNFNFDAISKTADSKVTAQLSKILSKHGLNNDHLVAMVYLKDC
jgi:hypothetical protein